MDQKLHRRIIMNERTWSLEELQGIISHVFLPRRIPTSLQDDLIKIEQNILSIVELTTKELNAGLFLDTFPRTCKLFKKWGIVQHQLSSSFSSAAIAEVIQSLEEEDMLAIYVRAQNAGLLISIPTAEEVSPKSSTETVILSAFPAAACSESVMSTPGDLTVVVPEASVVIPKSALLHSEDFAEQLGYLTREQIELTMPKSSKAGHSFNEVRDIVDPMFITEWAKATLCGEESEVCEDFPRLRKKVRDDVNLHNARLPFRRSGLWLTAKVALQISLIRELGPEFGTAMYKAVLIKLMHLILIKLPTEMEDNWDLKIQMLAKLARRLEKLKLEVSKWPELDQKLQNGFTNLAQLVTSDIQLTRKVIDNQWDNVTKKLEPCQLITLTNNKLRNDSCHKNMEGLQSFIQSRMTAITSKLSSESYLKIPKPRCPTRWTSSKFLNLGYSSSGYDQDFELWDTEVWIRNHLDIYCCKEFSKPIWNLITKYSQKASSHYKKDPVGNSRMVLTVLKCLQVLDRIAVTAHPMLKGHKSGVEMAALNSLLIPLKGDMKLLQEMEDYFRYRNDNAEFQSLISQNSPCETSFSVRFAKQFTTMNALRTAILEKAERDIMAKKQEVLNVREQCQDLQARSRILSHESIYNSYYSRYDHPGNCTKCYLESQFERTRWSVQPFERPLSNKLDDQFAVVFELLIPCEIACLRDGLHVFRVDICGYPTFDNKAENIRKQWKQYAPLAHHNNGEGDVVILGTLTVPTLETRFARFSVYESEDSFIFNNGMNLVFYGQPILSGLKPLKDRCTFKIEGTEPQYTGLQWTVDGTSHTPNEVLARQYSCHQELSLPEFIQFGNLRAGHRLQYRNIVMSLVNEKLSLKTESVFLLLCQAQWQAGPPAGNFLRDSHQDFSETQFARESLQLLNELVDANSKNWSDTYTLLNLVVLSIRLLELVDNNSVRIKVAALLRKCRNIANSWINTISDLVCKAYQAPDSVKADLKLKLVDTALCSVLTYHVSTIHIDLVMASSEDLVLWLFATSTLYDEIHWNTAGRSIGLSPVRLSLLRLSINIGMTLEARIADLIDTTQGTAGLIEFTAKRWKAADTFGIWQRCATPAEQVFECHQAVSNDGISHVVHVDIIMGKFLVDGCPVGTLPEEIAKSDAYQRVFLKADFRVQPDKDRIFTTTSKYHGSIYDFYSQNNNLIVNEVKKGPNNGMTKLELISHTFFQQMVPHNLVAQHSHWWNASESIIIFRSKSFDDPEFADSETYELSLDTMILKEIGTDRNLISVKSQSFSKLISTLERIEPPQYIHAWLNEKGTVEIELVRLGLKFQLENGVLLSHEFPGMKISINQNLGTFVGLRNQLVLDGKRICKPFHPHRKVIVPHGSLLLQPTHCEQNHQLSTIDLQSLREPRFFAYDVDERFQILKAGRNQSAWFYLAALHAATSSSLPDPFTGITGTERTFQILQSARCWSSQPYDKPSLKALKIIAEFSPKRTYYPEHLKCMQQVNWPNCLPTTAAHEGFAEVALKLFQDSQRLGVLFQPFSNKQSSQSHNVSNKNDFAEKILAGSNRNLRVKHYWRQIPLGNELSTISEAFDDKFQSSRPSSTSYERVSLNGRVHEINAIRTIADLCHSWRFHLESRMISLPRALLVRCEDLTGLTKSPTQMTSTNIKDWLELKLRNEWINLYSFALKVVANNWKHKWALIMSTMAFTGAPLEEIMILQAIAVHPENFPDAPCFCIYTCPSETFSRQAVLNILNSEAVKFSEYNSCGDRKYSTDRECRTARDVHDSKVASQVALHADHISNQWPTGSYNRPVGASKINIQKAEVAINQKLKQWYENYQLTEFLIAVEVNLEELLELSSKKPQISNFLDQDKVVNNRQQPAVPLFSIDFDKMLTFKISKTKPDRNTAKIYESGTYGVLENSEYQLGGDASDEHNLSLLIKKSKEIWSRVTNLMTPTGSEALVASGLYPRLVPSTLLPVVLENYDSYKWKIIQSLVGAVGVLWTMEQRLIRCITYLNAGTSMEVALRREIETTGHENWSPMDQPGWLILELEMNMMIRPIQLKVAQEMMNPRTGQNSVMQLNMGEGKTSLIVPMLAISLANGHQLCRVTVLKSIFETNLNHLRHTLGGLLNQRIYTVPCRRDIEIDTATTRSIRSAYQDCMKKRGIVVTLPEYRLSFQLKGYEMARNGKTELAKSLIYIQGWLNAHTRDILDESDEILSVKYQLVYTVGDQLHVGGGEMRWFIAQKLLKLLPQRMKDLYDLHGESSVEYDIETLGSPEIFTPCRLLRKDCYEDLIDFLAEDFLGGKLMSFPELKTNERTLVKRFLTINAMTEDEHEAALKIFEGDGNVKYQEIILILAGYLRYEVLQAALGKRWRVNYGVNLRGHRKMAVPFKAKDVASERTEFGHPDMAIILTQLSYYYSGLSDDQLSDCFDVLKKRHRDPMGEYDSWIQTIPASNVHPSVRKFNGINISDYEQRTEHLFPMLRKVMAVIDFWLSNIVFPKESKQFPGKMTCTAWDLASQNQKLLTTGFSGTNDSSNLYPLTISQNDLKELQSTNQQLEETLLRNENDSYKCLPCGIKCLKLLEDLKPAEIRVLLDCGALMLEMNNEEVAKAWLETDKDIQAVVYFNKSNVLTVKSRQGKDVQFELSPFRDRMDVCAVYLDDEHTRGTDLKFPRGSKACVTIGSGLTRDKMVQACMRMRMLGQGHTVSFWASHEAHNKIRDFTDWKGRCSSKDVLEWVCDNSKQFQNEGLVYWTASGVNYCQKMGGEAIFETQSQLDGSLNSDHLLKLGENCSEKEVIKLMNMYGQFRKEEFFINIIPSWFYHALNALTGDCDGNISLPPRAAEMFDNVKTQVVERCRKFIPEKKNFAQLLEEEQEKELEHELEDEKEVVRPHEATPHKHHFEARRFVEALVAGNLEILKSTGRIWQLSCGFQNTQFWEDVQPNNWGDQVYVTDDFTKTIVPKHVKDTVDVFLRPPAWVVSLKAKDDLVSLILISPFEANKLIHTFRKGAIKSSKLHLYTPRLLPDQRVLIDAANFCLPPRPGIHLSNDLLAPLSVFSGALYFSGNEEQTAVADFLGIIPRPRTKEQDEAFQRGDMAQNGYLKLQHRTSVCSSVRKDAFEENPDVLIREITRTRNQGFVPPTSHIAKLVFDGMKNEFKSQESNKVDKEDGNNLKAC